MRPPRLAALQDRFQVGVLGGKKPPPQVLGDDTADAAERFEVYVQAYRLRLLEALGEDYPALRRLLGAAGFERLGRAYIAAYPSETASLRWFGRYLPQYLRARRRPLAAELAQFEWCKGLAFDAPDEAPLEMAAVAALPAARWPALRLQPQACVQRLNLYWNVAALVQACASRRRAPRPRRTAAQVHWLLWRGGAGDIRWRSQPPAEAAAWDAAAGGAAFGAVCERLGEWLEPQQTALHAAGLLKRWLADGLLAGMESSSSRSR